MKPLLYKYKNTIKTPLGQKEKGNNLTLDVQEDVLTPSLADPVGRLTHVVPGLALVDPLEDQAEVGEDDAVLGGVPQAATLEREV